jgi:tetratricopeptide (TPR) repeat protein
LIKRIISVSCFVLFIGLLIWPFEVAAQRDRKKKSNPTSPSRLREAEFFFIEAEKYYLLEDYAKALLYFQRVAELNPENPTVHYKIAQVLSKGNKDDDLTLATVSVEYAIRLDPSNKYFYLLSSQIYANLTNFGKAAQALETMMEKVKGSEEYLYDLAALYQYDRKPEEAIKAYDKAEAALGIDEVSSLQKQRLYFELGKKDEAIREGDKLIEAFPDEERYVVGFAETLSQNKEVGKAIALIEKFLQTHPEAGSAKVLLSGLYRDNGEEQKARDLLAQVFDDPNVNVTSKIIVLSTYSEMIRQQKPADANLQSFSLELYDKLKASHSKDPNVRIVGGDLFLALEQKLEARNEYYQAIVQGSTAFDAWQNMLLIESELDEIDSLIVHSEESLELFPNQSMLYYFNGYAHLRRKNYKLSVSALEQARKLSSANPGMVSEINGMLGDAYNGVGDYLKSDQAYEDALSFNPNSDYVLNNYSYYLALRREKLDKAEKMSSQLIRNNPDNPTYLDTYAWVLFAREKYKDAKKIIERTIQTGDTNPAYFEHYGDILFKLGQIDEAVKQWEKAKELNGDNELIDKKIANRKLY